MKGHNKEARGVNKDRCRERDEQRKYNKSEHDFLTLETQ